jgi:signal transduction histidine kinase
VSAPARILNVDDYEAARYARSRVLRQAGFEVLEAASGEEALRLVKAERPDVVVLDVRLPDVDGYEVCRNIKADPAVGNVQVIQVSAAYRRAGDHARGLEAGADAYLVEPIAHDVLRATVRSLVRARDAEEALRRAAREWRLALDAVSDGVCFADAEGRVTRHNAPLSRLAGGALIGRPLHRVLADVLGAADGECLAAVHPTGLWTREAYHAGRWLCASAIPVRDDGGRLEGTVCIVADVTERRRLEEMTSEMLSAEQRARLGAEAANQAKDAFLAVLSHELRTPLTAMLGWLTMLRSGRLEPAATVHALETVERNTRLLGQIIEDLLDVSRVISGKMSLVLQEVALEDVVHSALETVRGAAAARSITLETSIDAPRPIVADGGRLQQVFSNLLSNAVKFTPDGGRIRVTGAVAGDWVTVAVTDTGRGIPASVLPHIFEPFRQAEAPNRPAHMGLGLGLAIVRHLVELHGGSVEATSPGEGRGATFTVRLPRNLRIVPEPGPAAEPGSAARLDGVRVLLVEDDAETRDVLGAMLRDAGAVVIAVAGAREALEAFRREPPDVVVSDLAMPAMSGFDLIRAIRMLAPEAGGATPAIALTAFAEGQHRDEALRAGFDRHVAKPVDVGQLARAVRQLLAAAPRTAA